jgi:hypothetical protein
LVKGTFFILFVGGTTLPALTRFFDKVILAEVLVERLLACARRTGLDQFALDANALAFLLQL